MKSHKLPVISKTTRVTYQKLHIVELKVPMTRRKMCTGHLRSADLYS